MDRSGLNKDRYFWALSAMESQIAIIDQACLDKMAGNKPRFFFVVFLAAFSWTSTLSRSIRKRLLMNSVMRGY